MGYLFQCFIWPSIPIYMMLNGLLISMLHLAKYTNIHDACCFRVCSANIVAVQMHLESTAAHADACFRNLSLSHATKTLRFVLQFPIHNHGYDRLTYLLAIDGIKERKWVTYDVHCASGFQKKFHV